MQPPIKPVPASAPLITAAVAALAVLALASVALPLAAPAGAPKGLMLACAKLVVLAFVMARALRRDVYMMQWSSMGILLFVAEGAVRVASDPPATAWLGGVALLASAAYFAAVLVWLRPLKKAARARRS